MIYNTDKKRLRGLYYGSYQEQSKIRNKAYVGAVMGVFSPPNPCLDTTFLSNNLRISQLQASYFKEYFNKHLCLLLKRDRQTDATEMIYMCQPAYDGDKKGQMD